MNEKTYNGWTNYETWACNLWHDAGWEDEVREAIEQAIENKRDAFTVKEEAAFILEDTIKSYVEDNIPPEFNTSGFYTDLLNAALSEINYYEIAKHYVDDADVFVAMWNMPGCLPEMEPAYFLDEDEARQFLADEIESLMDDEDNPQDEEIVSQLQDGHDVHYNGYVYTVAKV